MIKRLLLGLTVAGALILGGAAMANAGEQHSQHRQTVSQHKAHPKAHGTKHHKVSHPKKGHTAKPTGHKPGCICKPKPTPPPGGWPCTHTHTCKPHKPHCPTLKPPPCGCHHGHHHHHHHGHKPPVHHPKPPVKHHPQHHSSVSPPAEVTSTPTGELAFTGASPGTPIYAKAGLGGLGAGIMLCLLALCIPKREQDA